MRSSRWAAKSTTGHTSSHSTSSPSSAAQPAAPQKAAAPWSAGTIRCHAEPDVPTTPAGAKRSLSVSMAGSRWMAQEVILSQDSNTRELRMIHTPLAITPCVHAKSTMNWWRSEGSLSHGVPLR